MMIDIDCFKLYNDTYGHQSGDDCLRKVASALQSGLLRAIDFVARYGGEEFAILLPATGSNGAIPLAESLCRGVHELGLEHSGSTASNVVTVSIGVATTSPAEGGSPAELIAAADGALYQAKQAGRNCVREA